MASRLPAIDRRRRSLSISKRLMPSVLAVHTGSSPAAADAAQLRAGGVLADTHLDPLVAALVEVIVNPALVVTTELSHCDGHRLSRPNLTTIWRSGSRAVVGHTDNLRRFQLMHIEPELLVFHLAQAVNVTPRRTPHFAGGVSMPAETLSKLEGLVATDPARAEGELRSCGVGADWADRIVAALLLRRCVWTVESVWLGDKAGRDESRLSVLDGGFAGYWRLSPGAADTVNVNATGFDDVLRRLAMLLP